MNDLMNYIEGDVPQLRMDGPEFHESHEDAIKVNVANLIHRAQLSNWASVTMMDAASAAITKVVEGAMFCQQCEGMDEAERETFLAEIRATLLIELGIRLAGLQ